VAHHREIRTTCNVRNSIGPSKNTLGLLVHVGAPPPPSMFKIGKGLTFDTSSNFEKSLDFKNVKITKNIQSFKIYK
jgi:hypothetical protein